MSFTLFPICIFYLTFPLMARTRYRKFHSLGIRKHEYHLSLFIHFQFSLLVTKAHSLPNSLSSLYPGTNQYKATWMKFPVRGNNWLFQAEFVLTSKLMLSCQKIVCFSLHPFLWFSSIPVISE